MRDEVKYSQKQLEKALNRLQEGLREANTSLKKDGVVQRFEFTFELLWKTVKIALEDQGILVTTPKETLQAAFKLGWIEEELLFLEMLEARNKMSHQYAEDEAQKVFKQIKARFIRPIQTLITRLQKLP